MNDDVRRELLRTPYRLRGRDAQGIDCLGVVWLIQTQERQVDMPDPWTTIQTQWRERATFDASTGLPSDWSKVEGEPKEGDILLFESDHVWCATLHEGHIWSAHPRVGVWCKPIARFDRTPKEIWRRC